MEPLISQVAHLQNYEEFAAYQDAFDTSAQCGLFVVAAR